MRLPRRSRKNLKAILMITAIVFLAVNLTTIVENFGAPQRPDNYSYKFVVDDDGSAVVTITYTSSKKIGSSWVLVPKFINFVNRTLHGKVLNFTLGSTKDKVDIEYYFYNVLEFFFKSNGYFEMVIQFNFTSAAMIIEPNGIFYSPQIGFQPDGVGKAEVIFPSKFKAQRAVAGPGYLPSFTNSNYVRFDNLRENMLRLEVEFTVENEEPDMVEIKRGIFTFRTVPRYEAYAQDVLELYNETYDYLTDFFNTTLEEVNVEFFIPDFEYLFSVGGYVPFSGERIGKIHINIFYTRYVKGYLEVTALHELVHHFLWRSGISPKSLLWFHEGMAQYISIEVSISMGYEGASMIKEGLEKAVSRLDTWDDLSFLLRWTLLNQPADWGTLYAAAYYVVTRIAEPYGGLSYYARFFRLLNEIEIEDNDELAYYLSLAANETIVPRLRSWGFDVADLYTYSTLIMEVERSLHEVSPIFQPYRFFADQLYRWALTSAKRDQVNIANRFLLITVIIAKLSPLLTLVTVSAVLFGMIFYVLKRKGLFSED